jgi:hypothetical protein
MKAEIADPENTSIAKQWHGKHLSALTNNHATTKELLEAVFSVQSVRRLCKEKQRERNDWQI